MNNLSTEMNNVLSRIPDDAQTTLETLINWSEINSGSTHRAGLDTMRQILAAAFSLLPGQVRELALRAGETVNSRGEIKYTQYAPALLIEVRPEAEIQLVLTGHYDTVFPKDSAFQKTKLLGDGRLGGPGVADMKGGILVMLSALAAFESYEQAGRVGYSVLLSPDEEIGSPGSVPVLHELGTRADVGLTYEPALADGSLAGARKGSGNFTLIIHGRAAHAGREHHLGRNAIAAMARFAASLDALNGKREGVTFNIAKIEGGGPVNIVPDLAVGRFNVRMQELADMDWIKEQLDRLVSQINAEDGLTAELKGGFTRPPKPMAPANALVFDWVRQAGQALGLDISWAPSGGVCEGNNLWAAGCANVDTLGVVGGHIHSDKEYMEIDSLVSRAQLSALILMQIAAGEFDARQAKKLALQAQKTEGN
ncbi:MAG TPA: hydrolase [Hellea balneolensis]|uniref:Hydrolase n=1 Tax=Hellea balneolensis TaxID=287478 RepID=A0A7V5NXI3_9PROT|nr:hydrolase [Hellea balneolensis]